MQVSVKITREDNSSYTITTIETPSRKVEVLKRLIMEDQSLQRCSSGLILFREFPESGTRSELSDDEFLRDEDAHMRLTVLVMNPHVIYTLITPNNKKHTSHIFSRDIALTFHQIVEAILREAALVLQVHDCRLTFSFDPEGRRKVSEDHVFERQSTARLFVIAQYEPPPRILPDDSIVVGGRLTVSIERVEMKIADVLKRSSCTVFSTSPPRPPQPEAGFLKIKLPIFVDSTFNPYWVLWSDTIMRDIGECSDFEIPFNVIDEKFAEPIDIVLLGVAGCGKSRTCYDLCRKNMCIYLDWANHCDLVLARKFLGSVKRPWDLSDLNQVVAFEKKIAVMTMRLLVCRWIVLVQKLSSTETTSADDYFQIQQLSRARNHCVFSDGLELIIEVPDEEIEFEFRAMIVWIQDRGIRIVMDEVQTLLDVLPKAFHSSDSSEVGPNPRSYFSFLAKFLRENGMRTVWAGTHLRIGDITRISSDVDVVRRPFVFQSFNLLTSGVIRKLLDKWVNVSSEALKVRISNQLQGRPRIFMSFIDDLTRSRLPVCDSNLSILFDAFHDKITHTTYTNLWAKAHNRTLTEFVDTDEHLPVYPKSVLGLLEDLLYNHCVLDSAPGSHHWYKSLVATALVMLGKSEQDPGLICEPVVIRSGFHYLRTRTRSDIPASTIIHRFISMEADEATRGKGVESLCVVRLREEFWLDKRFWPYFPDVLISKIEAGRLVSPLGVHDCRTGDANHRIKLRNSFLCQDATHVVRPQSRMGCADVVYSYFSFHVKTKWTDVRRNNVLKVSNSESVNNESSINKTWKNDDELAKRVADPTIPWVRFLFEFPTNNKLESHGVKEIIERDDNHVTITAGIHSEIAEMFFGESFITLVNQLTRQ